MDIFKLFFDHDLRLDKTVERNNRSGSTEDSLEDFMSPTPVFSKFYITGTALEDEKFGLNCLAKYPAIFEKLDEIFEAKSISSEQASFNSLSDAVQNVSIGFPVIISNQDKAVETELSSLVVDDESNVGHFKDELRRPLLNGHIILYKEKAKNGFDLHLFSRKNIYPQLFYSLKELVDDSFRFFSVNSKRMRSERHFYFETWRLDRPLHGAEAGFEDAVL